jgi:hypothetical protein
MAPLPWIPRFFVGAKQFTFSYPVTRWIPGERTTGFTAKDADGNPGVEIHLRRYTLAMSLRFTDDEWTVVREFIRATRTGRSFTWEPRAQMTVPDMPDTFDVVLESPLITTRVQPTRDGQYPHVMTLPIVLGSDTVFHAYYFPVT